ncbi:MAG: glycosyltransferase family 2 protein [Vicinamibacterales bacterium]
MLARITPLVLTFNEAPNLARTLERLAWAGDIVVVDSGSSDGTREIAARNPRVRVFEHPFSSHAEQWNFGLESTGIRTEWVLALDADFVLSEPLVDEIAALDPDPATSGYRASFAYCIGGTPLRGAAYPPVVVLYRRTGARYVQDGHTQRIRLDGRVDALTATIAHDDRKPLAHWIAAQVRYMRLEAEKLDTTPASSLGLLDRLRRLLVVMPPAMFVYCYVVRGGVLSGRAGLFYALQRATAEAILSLSILERRLFGDGRRRH